MKTLQVGESYENRLGTSYLIECCESEGEFRFRGVYIDHNGEADYDLFTEQGRFVSFGCSDYDLIIPDEPQVQQSVQTEVKPEVPHFDVILAIVQKIPVEFLDGNNNWMEYDCEIDESPVDCPEYNWRIKPKLEPKRTVKIGKRTVVAPEVEAPKVGTWYHKCFGSGDEIEWLNDTLDNQWLESGLIFLEKQDAVNCQEAIKALLLGTN